MITKSIEITRIYQGKVIDARFVDQEFAGGKSEVLQAMERTHRLFQDAVNYHLVALAGMADEENATVGGKFREQVKAIWQEHPRGDVNAATLQQSVCRTLCLGKVSFEEAVATIFEGCERPDILPYVQQYIIDKIAEKKGEKAIQNTGGTFLPRLCEVRYRGNFDYSDKQKKANKMKGELMRLLEAYPDSSEMGELASFARRMDLSWSGLKTQPGEYWNASETALRIQEEMIALLRILEGSPNEQKVRDILSIQKPDTMRCLAKPSQGCSSALKRVAIFFMYYPCPESVALLKKELSKRKEKGYEISVYDYSSLEDDPLILTRGQRGYVYRGFTALPVWESRDGLMYEKEWDILAFKEALKALHAFSDKTEERQIEHAALEKEIAFMKTGKGKLVQEKEDEDVLPLPVLGGDRRYALLCELVKELRLDEDDRDYWISQRALKGWEDMLDVWNRCIRQGAGDTASLQKAVREQQGKKGDFGAQVLFHALCEEKYRPIWKDSPPQDRLPRSLDILRDFGRLQEKERDVARLLKPVGLTAAEPRVSPRLLMYSELKNLGAKSKGCQAVKHQEGMMRLRVVVRNSRGHLQGATVQVRFSAPRLLRDQLGLDSDKWSSGEESAESVAWLQPMLAALGLDRLPGLKKELAVSLEINYLRDDGISSSPFECLLNFPATLDMSALQKSLGIMEQWEGQFHNVKEMKLYLHWPDTYSGKSTPWWAQKLFAEKGFNVLSVDLGMRYAAAWSLVHVGVGSDVKASRFLGSAGGADWYGRVGHSGFIRLEGEKRLGRVIKNLPGLSAGQLGRRSGSSVIYLLVKGWRRPQMT